MLKRSLVVLGLFLLGGASQAAEVEWVTDYSQALQKAQKEKKRLLIDFYSPT